MGGVDWVPAIVFLVLGLVFGVILVLRTRRTGRRETDASGGSLESADLQAKLDALIDQLRELEDTAVGPETENRARQRFALELQAARTLLALKERRAQATRPHGQEAVRAESAGVERSSTDIRKGLAGTGIRVGGPALRGFLWGVGIMAAAGFVVFLLARSTKPRGAEVGGSGSATIAPLDAEERRLQSFLVQHPDDIETRLDLARLYLERQDMMRVWSETSEVLVRSPENPRALAYQATVRVAMGQTDMAIDMLKKAITADPKLVDAHVHLALAYATAGRLREAHATIDDAIRRFPEQAVALRSIRGELTQFVEAPAATESNPHASVPPPGTAAPDVAKTEADQGKLSAPRRKTPTPSPAAGAVGVPSEAKTVAGTVELHLSLLGKVPSHAVVFITVRDAVNPGAPAAVERIPVGSLPARFEIGSSSAMAGGSLPARMRIEARLDDDGNAATRSPADPIARIDGAIAGEHTLRLMLKRPEPEGR